MSADAARYARLHAIFEEARTLAGGERGAFLDRACASDLGLRGELEELLASLEDEDSDAFSETGIARARGAVEGLLAEGSTADATWLPERVGRYRILRRIGEGGMGVVYEAEQDSPRRRVAIKLLHPLQATAERLRRFRHEAQLLGRLQHPGIAQIHEAGTYDVGRGEQPFFAMELVDGVGIRLYAESARLDARDRLALVADVADAAHHAHGRGVIHRDLKPANVLVDTRGQPKVLDFGVARTRESSDLVSTLLTQEGVLLGTLAYMAPEQLSGDSAAITPRSDVYALGVLAFELLTGRLPHEIAGLALPAALRTLEREPTRSLSTLVPALRGDVETIVSKALERDPAHRYPSAEALAADLRRHIDDLPIAARAPSRAYLLKKYVRRNRPLVASLASILAVLMAGLMTSASQYFKARNAAQLADTRYEEIIQLADLKRLADARAAAADLWPAHPRRIEAMQEWLSTQAAALRRNLPRHRATLASLRSQALPSAPPGEPLDEPRTWQLPSEEGQWQHDALAGLVDDLEAFTDPDPRKGLIANVEGRLEFARTVESRSLTDPEPAASWRAASADIARLAVYGGLRLEPQLGLVPLQRDPQSGLWEFWHVQTGARPLPNPDPQALNSWILDERTGLVFVLIPGSTFAMGAQAGDRAGVNHDPQAEPDEGPVHDVDLDPFLISKYEMTQGQWQRFTGTNPSNYGPSWSFEGGPAGAGSAQRGGLLNPVEQVSWSECALVLSQLGLALPSEAQWEFAARAGTDTPWWTGQMKGTIGQQRAGNVADAWSRAAGAPASWPFEPWEDHHIVHAPVGEYRPNAFGLHDTIGNLWEWCADRLGDYDRGVAPGSGLRLVTDGIDRRVARGGSFGLAASVARSSARYSYTPEYRNDLVGLRPVRAVKPSRPGSRGGGGGGN